MKPLANNSLLRQWDGPLTKDLVLAPGKFGLGKIPERLKPDATTRVTCGFCSTGCSLDVHLNDGVAVNLSPTSDYPVNLGMACPKGWEALTCLSAPDRGTTPLIRHADGSMKATTWDEAMKLFAEKFKSVIAAHGPESVAFLSTGQICTEEMALLGALWKFGIGAVHCDSNTRQCMATAHVAYKQSFGFDAPPFTYADFELSDTLVFIGANPCIAHPIMWQRVLRNKNNPRLIVVDPRRTETAMNATQHLALKPKSDLTLLYGIANLLIQNRWIDREFIERSTSGFEDFAAFARQFTPDKVAAETGLSVGELYRFAETIHNGKAVSFWWTMGVNQSHESTRTAQAIINLALMTGNIGRPGTGANSITGQCNAMGSRLYSNITGLFGGRDFLKTEHRAEIAGLLEIPVERIPARNSMAYDQIIDGIRGEKIKALWVIATNPSHSWIGRGDRRSEIGNGRSELEAALGRLEFLVVQDMFTTTETAQRADLFLPAAGWGEKEGTFINSERRIGLIKKVSRAPGEALSDFNIFRLVANYWGCADLLREWSSPEAVFQILKKLSASQPCDITGIRDYAHLDAEGGIQWPLPTTASPSPLGGERAGVRGEDGMGFQETGHTLGDPHRPASISFHEPEERKAPALLEPNQFSSHRAKLELRAPLAPVHGPNARPISEVEALHEPCSSGRESAPSEIAEKSEPTHVGCNNSGVQSAKHRSEYSARSDGKGRPEGRTSEVERERRLFEDGRFFTPDGRAKFLFEPPRAVPEPVTEEFPLILLTGRGTSAQWHTNTRTGKSDVLRSLYPKNVYVEINPADAARLCVVPNSRVAVISRRGRIECAAFVTSTVQPGQVFIPMHYDEANQLTRAEFDPYSRQPSYKHCAVKMEVIPD